MIFLTDGFPTSKGHKAEYNNLKEKYPDIIINGIQYELGNYIIQDIKDMSDYQYTANRRNLEKTLFAIYETATNNLYNKKVLKYESFSIEDILSDDFEVDFVAENREGIKYYQVALSVRDEDVLKRELRALEKTGDHYPKYLLTLDMDLETDYNGIRKINVVDWLLEN